MQEYLHKKRMKIINKHLGGNMPDLDLGAGRKPKASVSIDINREFKPNIVADVQHLPIRSKAIDSIICSHVIEHVDNLSGAMGEIIRVLSKNGMAVFFLPDDGSRLWRMIMPLWTIYYKKFVAKQSSPDTHLHSFSHEGFKRLIRRSFKSSEFGKINSGMEMYAVCKCD